MPDDLGIYLYNNWKRQKKDQIVITLAFKVSDTSCLSISNSIHPDSGDIVKWSEVLVISPGPALDLDRILYSNKP